jgi:hypothetical protein
MNFIQWGLHAKIEMVKSWGFVTVTHLCIFFQLQQWEGNQSTKVTKGRQRQV